MSDRLERKRQNARRGRWALVYCVMCTEAEILDEIQTKFSSLVFTVTSTALPWDFYLFKLTQPLTVSVKGKGGKPDHIPFPMVQDYAQKPQWNITFMNSASIQLCAWSPIRFWWFNSVYLTQATNPIPIQKTCISCLLSGCPVSTQGPVF